MLLYRLTFSPALLSALLLKVAFLVFGYLILKVTRESPCLLLRSTSLLFLVVGSAEKYRDVGSWERWNTQR
jgi:hypothetical protein